MNYNAYILTGGKSSRFGTDKALIKLGGKPIIQIIADELKKIFQIVTLVTDRPGDYSFLSLESVADTYTAGGPLAGIHTALKHSVAERNFIISCDMPLINSEIIKYIIEYPTDKNIVIPFADGRKQYLCAIYNKCTLKNAEALLEATKNDLRSASPYDLIMACGYELIDFDAQDIYDKKCFFNLNSPEDLSLIRK